MIIHISKGLDMNYELDKSSINTSADNRAKNKIV